MKEGRVIDSPPDEEPFLSRWSRRKQASLTTETTELTEMPGQEPLSEAPAALTDADMPPLDSLDENSDYSGFFSPEVTDALRQQALNKLFRSACFNRCDGLDDYADDFTQFEKLGDVMTADLRHRLQQEARRMAEKGEPDVREAATPESPERDLAAQRETEHNAAEEEPARGLSESDSEEGTA